MITNEDPMQNVQLESSTKLKHDGNSKHTSLIKQSKAVSPFKVDLGITGMLNDLGFF